MGSEFGPLFNALTNECAWLQCTWSQYIELFGTSEERVDILNRAAPFFFRLVDDAFWNEALLQLTRITDPPRTGRASENLTLKRIPDYITDPSFRREVEDLISTTATATAFARDWRNRHIAHRDLKLALQEGAKPLAPATAQAVRSAIDAACAVIRHVHRRYFGSDLILDLWSEPYGATSMLFALREGIDAEEARRGRLLAGTPLKADLVPPRAV